MIIFNKLHKKGRSCKERPFLVKICSNTEKLTNCQSRLTLFVHEPLDTHLRSLLERLLHDLDKVDLAVSRH